MKASFDQQAAHSHSAATGSRQAAQSCGSATPSASPKMERAAPVRRAHRPVRAAAAVTSVVMSKRYRPAAPVVKAVRGLRRCRFRVAAGQFRLRDVAGA